MYRCSIINLPAVSPAHGLWHLKRCYRNFVTFQLWMYIKCMHDTLLLAAVYKINIEVVASIGDADRPDAHAIKTDSSSVSFYPGRIGSRVKGPVSLAASIPSVGL